MVFSLSNINVNSNNFFANPSIVKGNELTQVSNEILNNASANQNAQSLQQNSNSGLFSNQTSSVFGPDSSLATQQVKLAATNQAAYDVTLSNKAVTAIQALNSNAVALQVSSIAKTMDGKVNVPADFSNSQSDLKTAFTSNRPAQFFTANSLDKDKKGSSPFYSNNGSKNGSKQEVSSISESVGILSFNNQTQTQNGINLVI